MVAQIPIGAVPTIYARVGDLFAWLCVLALSVFVTMALLARA
jgi:apolipoprotein N-acyltransferase